MTRTHDPAVEAVPRLTVVVVSLSAPEVTARCLDALAPQGEDAPVDILVVGDFGAAPAGAAAVRTRFPTVRWVDAPGSTVPERRRLGLDRARGTIVALLEDDCLVPAGWCRSVIRAHAHPSPAIGGPVEPGPYRRALDWAVYFCEYAAFLPPFAGEVRTLPGNNVTYKRCLVARRGTRDARHGFLEGPVHDDLLAGGHTLLADPALGVRNVNAWQPRHLLSVPFHHGRAFGARRVENRSRWLRLGWLAVAGAVPALRVARVIRTVWARPPLRRRLMRALPWVTVFSVSWSLGELIGYASGPGTSAARWR